MNDQHENEASSDRFEEIKNHPAFQKLNLTDEEILQHHIEIEKILEIDKLCSNTSGCRYVSNHYKLERDDVNKLIFSKYSCNKKKKIDRIDDEVLNKHIKEKLISEYDFDNKEAKSIIKQLFNNEEITKEEKDNIKKIGTKAQIIENQFILTENRLCRQWIYYAYSMILKNQKVCVIKSQTLKQIIGDYIYDFGSDNKTTRSESSAVTKYNTLLNIENLIIIELGYENDLNNTNYFLDFLPNFLSVRNNKKFITITYSDVPLDDINKHISKHPKYTRTSINSKKLNYCFSLINNQSSTTI